ncbi:MAG: OmpA family protein [Halieaceae bacterium]|jgi:flagellar motor protein MotB|nr:OmpA family protein [Halieaceae bacterium]
MKYAVPSWFMCLLCVCISTYGFAANEAYTENRVATEQAPESGAGQTNSIIILVDNSASMKTNDPHELRKAALRKLIDIAPADTSLGIVGFSSEATVIAPLTDLGAYSSATRMRLKQRVATINAAGKTNIPAGLGRAATMLGGAGDAHILLLTDGKDSQGWRGGRRGLSAQTTVHAIALSGQADVSSLEVVTRKTGGRFDIARSARDLDRIFQSLFGAAMQLELNQFTQNAITPDEVHQYFVNIEPGADHLYSQVEVSDSGVVLELVSPSGQTIDNPTATRGSTGQDNLAFAMIDIPNPEPGRWVVELRAPGVGPKGESYILRTTSRGNLRPASWQSPDYKPAINDYKAVTVSMRDTLWHQALVTVWAPNGRQLSRMEAATSAEGVIDLPALDNSGTHRVQIVAQGISGDGHLVSRGFDKTIEFAPASKTPVPKPTMELEQSLSRKRTSPVNNFLNEPRITRSGTAVPGAVASEEDLMDLQPEVADTALGYSMEGTSPESFAKNSSIIDSRDIFQALTAGPDNGRNSAIDLDIQFEINSVQLSSMAVEQLVELGDALRRIGANRFEIAGHTDSLGSFAVNLELSRKRAASVRVHLINNLGLSPDILVATGYGEHFPRTGLSGKDKANRRVEITNRGRFISAAEIKQRALARVRGR